MAPPIKAVSSGRCDHHGRLERAPDPPPPVGRSRSVRRRSRRRARRRLDRAAGANSSSTPQPLRSTATGGHDVEHGPAGQRRPIAVQEHLFGRQHEARIECQQWRGCRSPVVSTSRVSERAEHGEQAPQLAPAPQARGEACRGLISRPCAASVAMSRSARKAARPGTWRQCGHDDEGARLDRQGLVDRVNRVRRRPVNSNANTVERTTSTSPEPRRDDRRSHPVAQSEQARSGQTAA